MKSSKIGNLNDLINSAVNNSAVVVPPSPAKPAAVVSGLPPRITPAVADALPSAAAAVPPPDAGLSEVQVDAAKTRMNALHRRSAATMSGEALQDLVKQIGASGQAVPALGWRLAKPDPDGVEYVLVYGARRRATALELGRPLRVQVLPRPLLDADVMRLMHAENHGRKDYMPLEEARELRAYLDHKLVGTQVELADHLGLDRSTVSRYLSLLEIPNEVLELYVDPSWMPLLKGIELSQAAQVKDTREALLAAVEAWHDNAKSGDPTKYLLAAIKAKPPKIASLKLKDSKGREVGQVKARPDGNLVVTLSAKCDVDLRKKLTSLLKEFFPTAKGL